MKKLIAPAIAALVVAAAPSFVFAAEPAPAAAANNVAALMGLENGSFRVLETAEADQLRGTGGCYSHGGLLGLNLNANLRLNVLGLVKVNTKVRAGVR